MSTLFECLMVSAFCISIALQLCRYIRSGTKASKKEIFMLVTMGIGFIVGAIKTAFSSTAWVIIFYGLGVMLTYSTVLFATSKDEDKDVCKK